MILMYSETSDRDQVPSFLSGVLDPLPHGNNGGFNKVDFFKARTFLQQVNFPSQHVLYHFINQLGDLFAIQYEDKPTAAHKTGADVLEKAMAAEPSNTEIAKAHKATLYHSYCTWMDALTLNGHQHTIKSRFKIPPHGQ
jgi:hypothetical protein